MTRVQAGDTQTEKQTVKIHCTRWNSIQNSCTKIENRVTIT